MADNITLDSMSGGSLVATDEVSIDSTTVHVQRVKPVFGASGSYDNDVDDASPMPVSAYHCTSHMQDGTTQLTPVFASIAAITADGDLIALVTGKKIRVVSMFATFSGTTGDETIKFQSGASTDLTGAMKLENTNDLALILPFNPVGWFETASGEKLNAVLTGTGPTFAGCITYVKV